MSERGHSWQQYDVEPEPERLNWPVPRHAYVLPILMIIGMSIIWAWQVFTDTVGSAGVSAAALTNGRYDTLLLHMFTHAATFHLILNMFALWALGPMVIARLGQQSRANAAFLILFVLSGFAGVAVYLAFHSAGSVPMVGASGALYGVLGLLVRSTPDGQDIVSIDRKYLRGIAIDFIKNNFWFFLLLSLPHIIRGTEGGLAWEAHLGGLFFGLLAAPYFLQHAKAVLAPQTVSSNPANTEPPRIYFDD